MSITGPDGMIVANDVTLTKSQAQAFRAIGKKRRSKAWPAGEYLGDVTMVRGTQIISRQTTSLTIE
ncbi:hypothetical protein RGAI101_190 [Roseobacter sp. GAI101]|nr:hypothetical protein RGAI101_190 [Roseobacter sp. GAI101]